MKSWLNWFFGLPRKVAAEIFQFVQDLANGIVQMVSDSFDWIVGWIQQIANILATAQDHFTSWIDEVIHWADSMMRDLFNQSIGWATNHIADAINWAQGELAKVRQAVSDITNWATRAVRDTTDWVQHAIFEPLLNLVRAVDDRITNTIIPWVSNVVAGAINGVETRLGQLGQTLSNAVAHLLDPIMKWIQLVQAAEKWLVWFATHGFDAIHDLFFGGFSLSPRKVLEGLTDTFVKHGDDVEAVLARYLFGMIALPFVMLRSLSSGRRRRMFGKKGD